MTWRALIVEDEPAWRELLAEMVADLGASVRAVASYDAAIAALVEGPYQLALIDLALAGPDHENQDGLRVLAQFRQRWPQGRAILITGYGTVELAVKALTEYGASDFIRKEAFDRERFLESVRRATRTLPPMPATKPALIPSSKGPAPSPPPTGTSGRVLVVEDNSAWQAIYAELCEDLGCAMQVAVSYGEARGWLEHETYHLVVVDLMLISSRAPLDNRDGFHLLRITREKQVPTIVVSALADPHEIDVAYEKFGIFAFFDKEGFRRDAFLHVARQALGHHGTGQRRYIPPDSPLAELTERQLEVLRLLAQGKTNKEIAEELVVTTNTVKKHVLAIYQKLGVNSRAAAAAVATQHGLM
ncbi:MAG: DNA-binding response regulator [Ardenticatenia bacterium]|nr:DNA-binding response regulator [Ardenticatenia bacterium]